MAQRGEVASRRPLDCDFTFAEDGELFLYAYDQNGIKHGLHRRGGLDHGYIVWADDKDQWARFTTFGLLVPNTHMGRNKLRHRLKKK